MTAASSAEPEFLTHIRRYVPGNVKLLGQDISWAAPIAIIHAPTGFDRSVWVDSSPDNLVAITLNGATVTRHFRDGTRIQSRPEATVAIQPRGMENHFTCDHAIRFAQIYLPDSLLDRGAAALELRRPASNSLPDLAFRKDARLQQLAVEYVSRASIANAQPATVLEMEARALLLVDRVLTIHRHGLDPSVAPLSQAPPGLVRWQVQRIVALMHARLADDLGLEELAREIRLSPFHFARAFRRATGSPPHRFLIELRLDEACRLLRDSTLSITEVSARVGYDDPGYLSRLFRRRYGVTPAQYRRDCTA